jgi:hypothetical protein
MPSAQEGTIDFVANGDPLGIGPGELLAVPKSHGDGKLRVLAVRA